MSKADETRQSILQAAHDLIDEQGVSNLTLEAVAARAGVSKGGLLYHYPSKEDLIIAMVQTMIDQFRASMDMLLPNESGAGAWLRAYIRASFALNQTPTQIAPGVLAAMANNPRLLEPLREEDRAWQAQTLDAGIDPVLATILRLATDGLWFADLLGLTSVDPSLREQVLQRMLRMTQSKITDDASSK